MSFNDALQEDRRLVILQLLQNTPEYTLNSRLLASALPSVGHNPSMDALHADLAWLAEQNLVTTRDIPGFHLATLTQRGADVAAGRAVAPGVKRPTPGA